MPKIPRIRPSPQLYVAVLLTLLSMAYWMLYAVNAYSTFHEYSDLAGLTTGMYYSINYPGVVHGLQYLIYGDHIAIDQLLVLPFFYISPSPITLLIVQAVVLSLTGLLVFFVTRDLVGNETFALAMCIAYLLNPGVHGLLVFDYHVEMLIIPFYILMFYYYMKSNARMFALSLVLLLCTIEVAPLLVVPFGICMVAYERLGHRRSQVNRARLRLAYTSIVVAVIFMVAYEAIYYSLSASYQFAYPNLPPSLRVTGYLYPIIPLYSGAPIGLGGSSAPDALASWLSFLPYEAYGIIAAVLGSGITVLFALPSGILLMLPWLAGVLLLENNKFFLIWTQYFAYVTGPVFAAAIIGVLGFFGKLKLKDNVVRARLLRLVSAAAIIISIALCVSSIYIMGADPFLHDAQQSFLFQTTPQQQSNYSQLNSMIALIPQNASVMTQHYIAAHLDGRQVLETIPYQQYAKPEYILVDYNPSMALAYIWGDNSTTFLDAYLQNNTYSVFARNGSAILYKAA